MIPHSEFCDEMQKSQHQEVPIVIQKLAGLFLILLFGVLTAVMALEKLCSRYRPSKTVQFRNENKNDESNRTVELKPKQSTIKANKSNVQL